MKWVNPDHGGTTGAARRARLNDYLADASLLGPKIKFVPVVSGLKEPKQTVMAVAG